LRPPASPTFAAARPAVRIGSHPTARRRRVTIAAPQDDFPEVLMARITVEDCLEVVDNRFELVLMATKRARQLANGADALVDSTNDKPTVLALREIAGRKISQGLIDEVDRLAREKAEREALEWAAAEVDDDLSKGGDDL